MTDVQWRRVFVISSLVLSLLLIAGSIYLHIKQKHHLGRINHGYNRGESNDVTYAGGVDAAVITATTTKSGIPSITSLIAEMQLDEINLENPLNNNRQYGDYEYIDDYTFTDPTQVNINTNFYPRWLETESSQSAYSESESNEKENTLAVATREKEVHHVTEACMQCICETTTECEPALCTKGGPVCGVFRISQIYWLDAGKPTVEGDNSLSDDMGYSHCVNNAYCASRTVAAFVNKNARDCNHDGTIDCRDHVALHILGPSGCMREKMVAVFEMRLETCLSKFE